MSAYNDTLAVRERLHRAGINATHEQAHILRRAAMVLHRWAELECGDGNDRASWSIERDETTGKPFFCTYPHDGKSHRRAIPDREKGALKRVAAVCRELGVHYYHQTDPRGCALYVSREPLTEADHHHGVGL